MVAREAGGAAAPRQPWKWEQTAGSEPTRKGLLMAARSWPVGVSVHTVPPRCGQYTRESLIGVKCQGSVFHGSALHGSSRAAPKFGCARAQRLRLLVGARKKPSGRTVRLAGAVVTRVQSVPPPLQSRSSTPVAFGPATGDGVRHWLGSACQRSFAPSAVKANRLASAGGISEQLRRAAAIGRRDGDGSCAVVGAATARSSAAVASRMAAGPEPQARWGQLGVAQGWGGAPGPPQGGDTETAGARRRATSAQRLCSVPS